MSRLRFCTLARTLSAAFCFLFLFGCGDQQTHVPATGAPSTDRALLSRIPQGWPYRLDAQAASGDNGMVVSDAPLATQVGVDVLKSGGNAVDATVATAFALAVVLPGAGNIGGGGFIVTHARGKNYALDFRETAPGAATRDMFLDKKGVPDEMDDFASKPGAPNSFGLIQGEANAIVPGKRVLSAMTPTIVLDPAGNPLLVTGAAGGPFIITTVFQLISDRLDFHMGVAMSANLPRIHHQHLPDEIRLEKGGFNDDTIQWLQKAGHKIRFFDLRDGGSLSATIERRGNQWLGQSDPRRNGLAKGY